MIGRRRLLGWLGFGGAAATVAAVPVALVRSASPVVVHYQNALYLQAQFNDRANASKLPVAEASTFDDVLTIYADGSVEFGPGFTADDASRAFWKKVGEAGRLAEPKVS